MQLMAWAILKNGGGIPGETLDKGVYEFKVCGSLSTQIQVLQAKGQKLCVRGIPAAVYGNPDGVLHAFYGGIVFLCYVIIQVAVEPDFSAVVGEQRCYAVADIGVATLLFGGVELEYQAVKLVVQHFSPSAFVLLVKQQSVYAFYHGGYVIWVVKAAFYLLQIYSRLQPGILIRAYIYYGIFHPFDVCSHNNFTQVVKSYPAHI